MTSKRHLFGRAGIGVAAAVVLVVLGGCSRPETPEAPRPFCQAAFEYEKELERQVSKNDEDIPRQIELIERIVRHAPREIRDDAKTFLDAMRKVETDPSVRDNPRIQEAVENVNRFSAQACEFYKSNRTPGGV